MRESKKIRTKYQETHDPKYIAFYIAIAIIGGIMFWLL